MKLEYVDKVRVLCIVNSLIWERIFCILQPTNKPLYTVSHDGIYELSITVETKTPEQLDFSAPVTVEMLGPYGYISATDFPFLPVS